MTCLMYMSCTTCLACQTCPILCQRPNELQNIALETMNTQLS